MTKSKGKVPVTKRALVQRINRALKEQDEVLRTARGAKALADLGEFYVVDVKINGIVGKHVDIEALGRKLKVLEPYEELSE
jgi:hypothetical protein